MVLTSVPGVAGASSVSAPVTPDADEAREWAERELSRPDYDIAEPTPFDRIARAVGDFFDRLFAAELTGDWGPVAAIVAAAVAVLLIAAAFLVWGVPRASRRVRAPSPALFAGDEQRSAAELREAADSHAARQEWDAAIVLRFRALARGCTERGIVDTPPGATVHGFARAAGRAFPRLSAQLEAAASAFDDVRYLRRPGTAALYDEVVAAEEAVRGAQPARAGVLT